MIHPMATHRQTGLLRKLGRRRHRQEAGLFVADGRRTVEQLLHQGRVRVLEIYATREHLEEFGNADEEVPHFLLAPKELGQISETDAPQGILALCQIPAAVSTSHWVGESGFLLAFDRIQDPGNLGTMIRAACWFGFDGLLVGEGTADLWNPKTVRSTVGATGLLPYAEGDMSVLLGELASDGWNIAVLDVKPGSLALSEWKPRGKGVIVVGNEAQGVSSPVADRHPRFHIPGSDVQRGAESLNAAVAASVAMYEVFAKSRLPNI